MTESSEAPSEPVLSAHDHGNCELCDALEAERAALLARVRELEAERDRLQAIFVNPEMERLRQRAETAEATVRELEAQSVECVRCGHHRQLHEQPCGFHGCGCPQFFLSETDVQLATERTLHAAWEKRAYEAEARVRELEQARDDLRAVLTDAAGERALEILAARDAAGGARQQTEEKEIQARRENQASAADDPPH